MCFLVSWSSLSHNYILKQYVISETKEGISFLYHNMSDSVKWGWFTSQYLPTNSG